MPVTELDVSAITDIRGLSELHLERRREYLTASDFPAVLGLDRFRNRGDVYMEKIGKAPPADMREPMAIGLCAEPAHKLLAEAVLGTSLTRRGTWMTSGRVGATLDFIVAADRNRVLQAKTRGSLSGRSDGDDAAPPAGDIIQVQVEMYCAEAELAYLSYLLGGFGPLKYRLFMVERDEAMIASLRTVGEEFMGFVDQRKRPPDSTPSLDTLRRIVRTPGRVAAVPHEPVQAYLNARGERLELERKVKGLRDGEDQALAAVLDLDPEAEAYRTDKGVLALKTVNVKEHVRKASSYVRFDWSPSEGVS